MGAGAGSRYDMASRKTLNAKNLEVLVAECLVELLIEISQAMRMPFHEFRCSI